MKAKIKRAVFAGMAVVLSVMILLFGMEVFFRAIRGTGLYNRLYYGKLSVNTPDKDFRKFRIMEDGMYWEIGIDFEMRSEGRLAGYRSSTGRFIPVEKMKDNFRLVTLGDSIGIAVKEGNGYVMDGKGTFSGLLEKKMMKSLPSSCDGAAVFNLSTGSYGPYQELKSLQLKGRKVRPNLILHEFSVNDFNGFIYTKKHPQYASREGAYVINVGEKNDPVVLSLPIAVKLNEFLTRHLVSFQMLNIKSDSVTEKLRRRPGTKYYELSKKKVFGYLDEINAISRKDGAAYLIVMFPGGDRPYSKMKPDEHPFELVQEFCESRKVHCLNLIPALRNYSVKDIAGDDGGHLTANGHRVVADIIHDYIQTHPDLLNAKAEMPTK